MAIMSALALPGAKGIDICYGHPKCAVVSRCQQFTASSAASRRCIANFHYFMSASLKHATSGNQWSWRLLVFQLLSAPVQSPSPPRSACPELSNAALILTCHVRRGQGGKDGLAMALHRCSCYGPARVKQAMQANSTTA